MIANKYVRGASILALTGVAIAVAIIVVRSRAPVEAPPGEALATEPGFVDVTQESGVRFRMQFLPNEQGERFKIDVYDHGTGIAVGDFDNDGDQDAFIPSGMGRPYFYWPSRLSMNGGDDAFVERSAELGVEPPLRGRENEEKIGGKATPRSSRCAVTLDGDGDGGLDLAVDKLHEIDEPNPTDAGGHAK